MKGSFMRELFFAVVLVSAVSALSFAKIPSPYVTDSQGNSLYSIQRTICGTNHMVPMATQSDSMKQMGTPIGIYEATIDGGVGHCTGTLITKDLFLTARHCAANCEDIKVTFGFLREDRSESFGCREIIEKGDESNENDYFIFRLEGNPGVKWGWYDVSAKPVEPKTPLLIIHHPKATPMKVSQKACVLVNEQNNMLNHRCDTEPGSSGSAILLPNYEKPEETRVVGVHTLGGCDSSEESSNSGPSMRHLIDVSATLKSLAK
jgi:Trypsin